MGIKLGILGGTFNPVHLGHLRLAEAVHKKFLLDKIVFIPTNIPPHKSVACDVGSEHRLNMVKIAIRENESFIWDDIEINRGGNSYTVDTIDYIYENYRFDGRPFFILGSDLVPELNTWKDVHRLAQRVHFIILMRDNYPIVSKLSDDIIGLNYSIFKDRKIEITSSEIRERLRVQRSVQYLVPKGVLNYIIEKGLYRDSSGD